MTGAAVATTNTPSQVRAADIAGSFFLAFAILVGKMNLPGIPDAWFTELRLPATILALVALAPHIRSIELQKQQKAFALAFGGLIVFLFLRGFVGPAELTVAKQVDLVYLAVLTVLVATCSGVRAAVIAVSVIGIGALYLTIAVANQFIDPFNNFGLGWGWPGSAITFNRIMFSAAACMLALALNSSRWRPYMIATCAVFAAAAIGSLQKSAILGIAAAFIVGYFFLLTVANWMTIVKTTVVCALAVTLALPIFGDKILGRVSQSIDTDDDIPSGQLKPGLPSPEGPNYQISPENGIHHPIIDRPSVFSYRSNYCLFERREANRMVVDYACRDGQFADRSERLVLWSEALRDFINNPLAGAGLASYEVVIVGAEYLLPYPYRYPHNLIFEVAAEGGIVALGLTVVAAALAFLLVSTSEAPLPIRIVGSMYMVYMLIAVMLGGDFYDSRMFWLAAALMAAWRTKDEYA